MSIDWNKLKSNAKAKDDAQYEAMKKDTETIRKASEPKAVERVTKAVSGAAKSSASGWVNTGGTVLDLFGLGSKNTSSEGRRATQEESNAQHYREMLERGTLDNGKVIDAATRARLEMLAANAEKNAKVYSEANEEIHAPNRQAVQNLQSTADKLSASAEADIAKAKQGLGKGGQFAVDVGVAGTQLIGDALTGGLLATGVRTFGSGAQEARQAGADLGKQIGYGAGSAAVGMATEKLANVAGPFKKAFGSGVLDKALTKMTAKPAGKLVVSALSEGGEEFIDALTQPILQQLTYNPDAAYDEDWLAEALYSAAVGSVLGGAGGAVDVATTKPTAQTSAEAQAEAKPETVDTQKEKPVESISEATAKPVSDPLLESILGGKRVEQSKATNEQFSAMADRGDVGIDSAGKLYKIDPAHHIDNRTADGVNGMKAFQFDHPELHQYYQKAAEALIADAEISNQFGMDQRYERTVQGNKVVRKAQTSQHLRRAMDETGLTRNQIIDAAQRIIHDKGQENVKAAKQIEIILDAMLSDGWDPMMGESVAPNQNYINAKNDILGAKTEETESVGAAPAGFDPYSALQNQNAEFHPEGANAARPVEVPTKGFNGGNISRFASNVMGAKAIPDDAVQLIEQLVAEGKMTYGNTLTNRKVLDRVDSTIRAIGFDGAMEKLRTDIKNGKMDVETIAMGTELLVNAANAGDSNAIAELAMVMQGLSTNAGRAMQFFSVLRKLDPTSQLYGIRRVVDQLNQNVKARKPKLRKRGNAENVPVEKWMEEVGNQLAQKLKDSGKPVDSAKPLTLTILSDLRKYASNYVPSKTSTGTTRTEADRLYDLMNNHRQYEEAWNAAKAKIVEAYKDDPTALEAFDAWLNEDVTSAFFSDAVDQAVKIPQELQDKFLAQQDQDGRDAVMEEIYQSVADQVPSNWKDMWDAWRYLSMLSSPRTHIRNIVGNLGFQPVRVVKNEIAALLERVIGVQEKTKSFSVSPAMYRSAWNDYSNVKDVLSGDRYTGVKNEVEKRVTVFKTKDGKTIKPLEKARVASSKSLEWEDAIFKRITYADSLAGYLQANGVKPEQLDAGSVDAGLLSRARDYAAAEALRATYQDSNVVSQKVQEVVGTLGVVGDALAPFKRTPANIVARAFEYSPAGLAKSLTADLLKVKSGEKSMADALDNVAKGVTGTGLFALGAYLFAKGLVTGGSGDSEEDKWNELLGHQGYAIELDDGTSVTLDWLAPESLPFFMGVEFMSSVGENGWSASDIVNSLWEATKASVDPLLEMSMLQGLNDLIESVQYAEEKPLKAMVPSVLVSYLTQAIPAVFGQIERTTEDVRMTTYTDKNKALSTDLQYALGKASGKLPFDYNQIPYIDAWGRTESSGDPLVRAANNFLNPAHVSKVDVDRVEEELQRLYDATGENVFPDRAAKYITDANGNRKDFTADEYVSYAKDLGQTTYNLVSEVTSSSAYKNMNNAEKVEYLDRVYNYADALAKSKVGGKPLSGYQLNAKNAQGDIGVSAAEFLALYEKYGSSFLSGDAYEKTKQAVKAGLSIDEYVSLKTGANTDGKSGVNKSEAMAALSNHPKRIDLWDLINTTGANNPYK